jgi:hypothetical protein
MGIEGILSALRLELRPGEWVLWDARPHRFESLMNDRTRIRDATTNEVGDVSVATLRGLPSDRTPIDALRQFQDRCHFQVPAVECTGIAIRRVVREPRSSSWKR